MLSIEYYVTSQGSRYSAAQLYVSPIDKHIPEWMESVARPETRHMESWVPLLGDPKHVIHVTQTVSTWSGKTALSMIDKILSDEQRKPFELLRSQHPDETAWFLECRVKTSKRVSRTDAEYLKQLQACISDE